jgi:putative transposase
MVYYTPIGESAENLKLMRVLDEMYFEDPTAGSRRLKSYILRRIGLKVNRKKIQRLKRVMGLETVYPQKRTTIPGGPSGIVPYLLKGLVIERPNQVWSMDITYIPMKKGFMYLFAIIDWYSRKILAWKLSNTLDGSFCRTCFSQAVLQYGLPEIVNTDQGCQFTSAKWQKPILDAKVKLSMDGRGRWLDNVRIERFWRTLKYEDIYLKAYETGWDLEEGIADFVQRYNRLRPHQSLGYATPNEMYKGSAKIAV